MFTESVTGYGSFDAPILGVAMGAYQQIVVPGMDRKQNLLPRNMKFMGAVLAPKGVGCNALCHDHNADHCQNRDQGSKEIFHIWASSKI